MAGQTTTAHSCWTPSRTVVASYTTTPYNNNKRRQQQQNHAAGDSILAMQIGRSYDSCPAHNNNAAAAALALSNGTVQIYAVDSLRQQTAVRRRSDTCVFRAMHCTQQASSSCVLLFTAWGDGSVMGTDLRCCGAHNNNVLLRTPAAPTTAIASSSSSSSTNGDDNLLLWTGDAAGSVQCWDPRHWRRPVWQHEQRHPGAAVTQIEACCAAAAAGSSNAVVVCTTGGSDGRVVMGTTTTTETTTMNTAVRLSAPVRRLGMSSSGPRRQQQRNCFYCITDDEALHEWSYGDDGVVVAVRTTPLQYWRNRLRNTSTSSSSTCTQQDVSYLIDCQYNNNNNNNNNDDDDDTKNDRAHSMGIRLRGRSLCSGTTMCFFASLFLG